MDFSQVDVNITERLKWGTLCCHFTSYNGKSIWQFLSCFIWGLSIV